MTAVLRGSEIFGFLEGRRREGWYKAWNLNPSKLRGNSYQSPLLGGEKRRKQKTAGGKKKKSPGRRTPNGTYDSHAERVVMLGRIPKAIMREEGLKIAEGAWGNNDDKGPGKRILEKHEAAK